MDVVVDPAINDSTHILGDSFPLVQRRHFHIDIELNDLNDRLLILEHIRNQRNQPMLGIIIQLGRDLQYEHNQIQRVKIPISKIQLQYVPDIPEHVLH